MIKRLRFAAALPEPLSHYTDAVEFGDTLWISGMLGTDAEGDLVGTTVEEQADKALANIAYVLGEVGLDFFHVVKVTVYLTDIGDRTTINPIRQKYFGEYRPASTLVEVSKLALPDAKVEIEAVAYRPHG